MEAPSIQGSGIVLGSGAAGASSSENSSRTIAGLVSSWPCEPLKGERDGAALGSGQSRTASLQFAASLARARVTESACSYSGEPTM